MDNRTCTGCGATFTPTHGRQRCCSVECRKPSHPKITLVCDCCGGPATKYKQARRYDATYCGTLCRDFAKFGPTSCTIPKDHWARWYGKASTWRPPTLRNDGTCQWCGDLNDRNRAASYCSEACKGRAHKQRRRAREAGAPGNYRLRDVVGQYLTQGRVCAYCSHPASGLPDPEHVVPLSRGGRNDMSNIVASCRPCNADKRDLLLNEWEADRARRGLSPVSINLTGSRFPHLNLAGESMFERTS